MIKQSGFLQISENHCTCFLEALAEHVACPKRLKISAFMSCELLLLLRLDGRVRTIPIYRVYRLYDIAMFRVCQKRRFQPLPP